MKKINENEQKMKKINENEQKMKKNNPIIIDLKMN